MQKILITGSGGVIGTVLKKGLPHDITDFDLPHSNVGNLSHILESAKGHDILIHLAWDTVQDNWLSENLNPSNTQHTFNVYEAAHKAGVKRVVMASSVHADKFVDRTIDKPLHPYDLPLPDSPYGAGKCMMEAMGRYYADAKGLDVVCIRFGGVNRQDTPPASPYSERQVWLSHRDCVRLITSIIGAPPTPHSFTILYGISQNDQLLHDLTNPFGWYPIDGAR